MCLTRRANEQHKHERLSRYPLYVSWEEKTCTKGGVTDTRGQLPSKSPFASGRSCWLMGTYHDVCMDVSCSFFVH